MNENLKIISIEPSGGGGIAHYAYCLNKALCEQGTACELLTAPRWNYSLPENHARIYKVFQRARTNPLQLFSLCRKLRGDASLVHWQSASHPKMLLWLMRFIPLKNIPWIYTVHNVLPHENNPSMIPLHRKIYRRIQGFIFHNQYSKNLYEKHYPECTALKTIISFGEFGFLNPRLGTDNGSILPNTPTLLFFGNIRPYKGLKYLLQAFQIVKRTMPEARLHIVGQALEDFSPYQKMIDEFRLNDSIYLRLEYVPDDEIPNIFQSASVVVQPYEHIDQSAVLFLALALGKTVVASSVGGIPEVIQDGVNGILVPPCNVEKLAEKLLEILAAPNRIQSIGATAAQDCRDRFAWDDIAKQTLEFYQQVTEKYSHG